MGESTEHQLELRPQVAQTPPPPNSTSTATSTSTMDAPGERTDSPQAQNQSQSQTNTNAGGSADATENSASGSQPRPRQRKFAPRSRQGCLTCRARRKRCDGQRPECQNCTRLNLTCEWQAQRRVVVVDKDAREKGRGANANASANASASASTSSNAGDKDDVLDVLAALEASSASSASSSGELTIMGSPKVALDPWDALPMDEMSERKHLLKYYVEAFVPSVSVADTPHSFYTGLYIPWAFQCEGVLSAILSLSSAQLARRTQTPSRAHHLRTVSAKHQRKCYAFLAERVPAKNGGANGRIPRDAHQVIGIILLLVGLEALNGEKSTRWLSQMKCVRDILNLISAQQIASHNPPGMIGPESTFIPPQQDTFELDSLRRHFTYHNAMASLMARVSKRSPESLLESDLSLTHTSSTPLTVDPLMGIAYYMCRLISRIQYVTSVDPAFPHITEAAFASIEHSIQSWTYNSPLGFPGLDLPIALDLIALAESYRLAALIQLYRTSPSPSHRALVPACASRAMDFMSRIPSGSAAESSMLYPLFLAGAELDNEPDITKCFKRLREIKERNCYDNVEICQKVLEEVWRPRLNGGVRRDWEDVVRGWGWSFTLG